MAMRDCATEPNEAYPVGAAPKSYPRLTLDLGSFPELNEVDKEVTLTVKARVCMVRSDDYGSTADLEVMKADIDDGNKADEALSQLSGSKF